MEPIHPLPRMKPIHPLPRMKPIHLLPHVVGVVTAPILKLEASISFWGGLDTASGLVIDAQHPDRGSSIVGRCLVLPGIRGSTAAPGALLACIDAGCGPAAIILAEPDPTALIAVLAAQYIGLDALPVYSLLEPDDMQRLQTGAMAVIDGCQLTLAD
jgi:predicted aconitase with swiveling domain